MITIKHKNDKPSIFFYQDNVFADHDIDFVKQLEYVDGIHNHKLVSRKQLWFQENKNYFCPVWSKRLKRWESNDYFKELIDIQSKVQSYIEQLDTNKEIFKQNKLEIPKINSCLINYYQTGEDFIPPHKDTPVSFGEYPVIVCLSYGETRQMVLKNNHESYTFELKSNSLFIMAGSSQKYYTHEILKSDSVQPRYSLTFREYLL